MCLAVSGEVLEVKENNALVNIRGIQIKVDISLIDNPEIGEYILIHGGFGIQKINEENHHFLQETIEPIYYEYGGDMDE